MNEKWHFYFIGLIVFLMFLCGNVNAAGKPMTAAELVLYKGADRQQILETGAKKEGKVIFYTVGIMKQSVRPIVDAFQKKYPYIKVEVWRAGTNKILPRVFEEYKAGRQNVDAIVITQAGEMVLEEKGILQPFYSPNLKQIDEATIKTASGGGAYAAGVYETTRGLGYNTGLISGEEVPKTHQDLLNPKWKGKMVIAGSNTGVSWMGTLLEAYGEDFVKKIAEQNFDVHMVSARAILDLVIAGEYALSPTISDSHANNSIMKGAPVKWLPLEPAPSYIGRIMLPRDSSHPHAALLFIDFNLTEQVADIYIKAGYTTPHKKVSGEQRYKRSYGPWSTNEQEQWANLFNTLFLKK